MPDKTPLRNFLDLVESQLDVTEPVALDDGYCVAGVAPIQGGLVGLDLDTGQPVRVGGHHYKDITEKPVIINTGSKQTIIPPVPPPPPNTLPVVNTAMAGQLYEDMRTKLKYGEYMTANDVETKNCFVVGCIANPSFYVKWRTLIDMMKSAEPVVEPAPAGWPRPPQTRQRIVDT